MGNRFLQKHPCLDCGKLIWYGSIRCSSCHLKYAWATNPNMGKNPRNQRGPNNASWKGGRYIEKSGYILVKAWEHPRGNSSGYVREHILVWERAYGKPIPKGWVIHHLNGIKGDNRIQNLIALPDRKHRRILDAKAKRIQELEALLNGQGHLL